MRDGFKQSSTQQRQNKKHNPERNSEAIPAFSTCNNQDSQTAELESPSDLRRRRLPRSSPAVVPPVPVSCQSAKQSVVNSNPSSQNLTQIFSSPKSRTCASDSHHQSTDAAGYQQQQMSDTSSQQLIPHRSPAGHSEVTPRTSIECSPVMPHSFPLLPGTPTVFSQPKAYQLQKEELRIEHLTESLAVTTLLFFRKSTGNNGTLTYAAFIPTNYSILLTWAFPTKPESPASSNPGYTNKLSGKKSLT